MNLRPASRTFVRRSAHLAVATVLATSLIASTISAANAEPTESEDEELVEIFEPEAPTQEGVEALDDKLLEDGVARGYSDNIASTVTLPAGVDAPQFYATFLPEIGEEMGLSGGALDGAANISITLDGSKADEVTDGVALSNTKDTSGISSMAPTTATGGQIVYVIEGESSDPNATFSVESPLGSTWETDEHGGLELVDSSGSPLLSVEAPWAVDASGRELPTHYETGDGYFTQVVDTEGAKYPIIADPSVAWYAKKAVLCLANIAAFGSIAAKAASVGSKIYKRLKAAKSGTQLYKAYQAWKKMGGSNADRAKALWSTLKEFANQV